MDWRVGGRAAVISITCLPKPERKKDSLRGIRSTIRKIKREKRLTNDEFGFSDCEYKYQIINF